VAEAGFNEGLKKGVFALSLDFELIWGTLDLFGRNGFRRQCERERAIVLDRLLAMLDEFEVPATWFILGHLFLDHCKPRDGVKHPEIVRPSHRWSRGDWFQDDPGADETVEPLFYGRSLVEKIRACRTPQEIGCHSFSHVIFGDLGCSRATASTELAACRRLAQQMGIELRSLAFPRNSVGHLDVVRENGFVCYRGPEESAQVRNGTAPLGSRLAHLLQVVTAAMPPVVLPERVAPGLWNIAGSMIYLPAHGVRRLIPISLRVRRALKGLRAAAVRRRIFHLWLHPTNLATRTDAMIAGLRAILRAAASMRDQGRLEFRSLQELVPQAGRETPERYP
jgi:peptidoglycan/xylan/chitin deacetylase (PgdA/CDA1 family)